MTDLLARLRARRTQSDHKRGLTTWPPINPDGEEAAARIEAMAGEIEGLREALSDAKIFVDLVKMRARREGELNLEGEAADCMGRIDTALTAPSMKENEDETRG